MYVHKCDHLKNGLSRIVTIQLKIGIGNFCKLPILFYIVLR